MMRATSRRKLREVQLLVHKKVEIVNDSNFSVLRPDYGKAKGISNEVQKAILPKEFEAYVQGKLMNGKEGGRPNLLQRLQKDLEGE